MNRIILNETSLDKLKPKQLELVCKLRKLEEQGRTNQTKMDKLDNKKSDIETKFNKIKEELNKNNVSLGYNFGDTLA